jgi:hypothetical protein
MGDVRRQLRPAWAHPAVWSVAIAAAAVGAAFMM